MPLTRIQIFALGLAGVTALAVGGVILAAPQAFHASYGIALGDDPNLLSELRAPGAGLAVLGGLMLAGVVHRAALAPALCAACAVYLGFPLGRVVGILADGMPSREILGALAVEVAIAGLLLAAFGRGRRAASRGACLAGRNGEKVPHG